MRIKGEFFYDMETHWQIDFSPHMVDHVCVNECEIMTINLDTNDIVSTEMVYVVIAVLENGVFAAMKPIGDKDRADMLAETLIQYCEDVKSGN